MAYFPNGTSGVVLDEQCADCLPEDPCPIALVQMEYNYVQCDKGQEKMRELLNCLVSPAGECLMKKYVRHRKPKESTREPDRSALKRPLIFGDLEQINAIKNQ